MASNAGDPNVNIGIRVTKDTGEAASAAEDLKKVGQEGEAAAEKIEQANERAADSAEKLTDAIEETAEAARRAPKIIDTVTGQEFSLSDVEPADASRPAPRIIDNSAPGPGISNEEYRRRIAASRASRGLTGTYGEDGGLSARAADLTRQIQQVEEVTETVEKAGDAVAKTSAAARTAAGLTAADAAALGAGMRVAGQGSGFLTGTLARFASTAGVARIAAVGLVGGGIGLLVSGVAGLIGWLAKGVSENSRFKASIDHVKEATGGLGAELTRSSGPFTEFLAHISSGAIDLFGSGLDVLTRKMRDLNEWLGIPEAENAEQKFEAIAEAAKHLSDEVKVAGGVIGDLGDALDKTLGKLDAQFDAQEKLSKAMQEQAAAEVDLLEAQGKLTPEQADARRTEIWAKGEQERIKISQNAEKAKRELIDRTIGEQEKQIEASRKKEFDLLEQIAEVGRTPAGKTDEERKARKEKLAELNALHTAARNEREAAEERIKTEKDARTQSVDRSQALNLQARTLATETAVRQQKDANAAAGAVVAQDNKLAADAAKREAEAKREAAAAAKEAAQAARETADAQRAEFDRAHRKGRIDGRSQRHIGLSDEVLVEKGVAVNESPRTRLLDSTPSSSVLDAARRPAVAQATAPGGDGLDQTAKSIETETRRVGNGLGQTMRQILTLLQTLASNDAALRSSIATLQSQVKNQRNA